MNIERLLAGTMASLKLATVWARARGPIEKVRVGSGRGMGAAAAGLVKSDLWQ